MRETIFRVRSKFPGKGHADVKKKVEEICLGPCDKSVKAVNRSCWPRQVARIDIMGFEFLYRIN